MRNEELIVSHIPYAKGIASNILREQKLHFESSDIESEAMYGLVMAGRRFDPDRGIPFHVFVRVRIAGQIEDWLSFRNQQPFHELLDVFQTNAELESKAAASQLRRLLRTLPKRWRALIVLRFWFGFTQVETAEKLGIGKCRVGQIQRAAIERLREAMQ